MKIVVVQLAYMQNKHENKALTGKVLEAKEVAKRKYKSRGVDIEEVEGKSVGRGQFKMRNNMDNRKFTVKVALMINQTVQAVLETETKTQASEMLGVSIQALYKRFRKYPSILKKVSEFNQVTVELAKQKLRANALDSANNIIDLSKEAISERAGIAKEAPTNNNIQVNVLNAIKEDVDKFDI